MEQRKNIWINKSNLDRFSQEHNKSGLVNDLLAQYYSPAKASRDITEPSEVRRAKAPAVIENVKLDDLGQVVPIDPAKPSRYENKDYGKFHKPGKGKAK